MAIRQPKGKTVRRLGLNIYGNPKYDKLLSRKPNAPGKERGAKKRGKMSVYGEQLQEKQKFRFAYGISERQFRNLFKKAARMHGVTGDNMISLMEQRLDNTIYRMGFAISRAQARQMCISVNDVITTKNKKGIQNLIRHNLSTAQSLRGSWLTVDEEKLSATINILPAATDIQHIGNIQNVVEYYSRSK